MRASLTIAKPDNEVEIGLLYSSSLDLDSESMNSFGHLALESAKTRRKALLDLHIHTFACPYCPQEIRETNCLSDGNYCAFFPKVDDLMLEMLDPEDFTTDNIDKNNPGQNSDGDVIADFSGRELLLSSIEEKCFHRVIKNIIETNKHD